MQCNSEGSLWCTACRTSAPVAVERCYKCNRLAAGSRTCKGCRQSGLYSVRAVTRYEGVAKSLVWKLKFDGARAGTTVAADMMASSFVPPAGAIITHVPTATSRVRQRGYDQAYLIARQLARRTGLSYQPLMLRLGHAQQHGATRRQRLAQLQGAFRVPHPDAVLGAHIVLVDDVITTGKTLEAAAASLKAAGARRVEALVFAQA